MIVIVGVTCYNNSVEKQHWFSVAPDDSVLVHFAVHDTASYHNIIATIIKWPVHVDILHTFNSSNFLIMEATIAITIKVNSGAVPVWE